MNDYAKLTAAFAIFAKYEHDESVAAEHDIIYAGPQSSVMTEADIAAVQDLDWHRVDEHGCWGYFT